MSKIHFEITDKLTPNIRAAAQRIPEAVSRSMYESLALVGQVATGVYMILTGTGAGSKLPGVRTPVNASRLTMRSGRLARSLTMGESGRVGSISKEGFQTVTQSGNIWTGTIGTTVPYAGIHEWGGFIKATPIVVTSKSGKTRRTFRMAQYFWAMYIKTGVDWYKTMALSVQSKGGVLMPPRAYLKPALNDPNTAKGIVSIFSANMKAALIGAKKP